MKSLDGKVAVVTGAGSGIGRAVALNLADKGALVAVSDVNEEGLAETVDLLKDAGAHEVRSDRLDVSEKEAMIDYAAAVKEQFGRVNVVVNNAGVSHTGPITEMKYSDFEWLMGINFWGVVYGTTEFLPHLIESGDGHLVNISSLFGLVSMPGQATYNASKYAVRGFTEAVREDMIVGKHKVGVTCVHPGGIRTNIVNNGRGTDSVDVQKIGAMFDKRLARTSSEDAAKVIVNGIRKKQPRVLIGADAHLVHQTGRLLGARYQDIFARVAGQIMP